MDVAFRGSLPQYLAGVAIEREEFFDFQTYIYASIDNCWRGDTNRCAEGNPPQPRSFAGIEGVEIAVLGADVDHTIDNCRGRGDVVIRRLAPESSSGAGIQRIERGIVGANIDNTIGDRGG